MQTEGYYLAFKAVCLCLVAHTQPFEAARWQRASHYAPKTRRTVYQQWNTAHMRCYKINFIMSFFHVNVL